MVGLCAVVPLWATRIQALALSTKASPSRIASTGVPAVPVYPRPLTEMLADAAADGRS